MDMDLGKKVSLLAISMALMMVISPLVDMSMGARPRGDAHNSDSEPNDNLVMATEIDQDHAVVPGNLGPSDVTDLYKIALEADGLLGIADNLVINVLFSNADTEPSVTLMDPWGFVLDHGVGDNVTLTVTTAEDITGYFYIQARVQTGASAYTLTSDITQIPFVDQDQNNHPSYADVLYPERSEVHGLLSAQPRGDDYQDFYKVHLEADGKDSYGFISAHLETTSGSYKMEVYDEYLTLLADYFDPSEPSPGAPSDLSYVTDKEGDYYLRVWAANGSGEYRLIVHVLTLDHKRDGEPDQASEVVFDADNDHVASFEDTLGYNSYPGESDVSDFWVIPLLKGQIVSCTVTSDHFDIDTLLPRMRIGLYDGNGDPYVIEPETDVLESVVEPSGNFTIVATEDGSLYIEITILGAGGGGYSIELFTNTPPIVVPSVDLDIDMTDAGPEVMDLGEVFMDPEGDHLTYLVHPLGDPGLADDLTAETEDDILTLTPRPRGEGTDVLTVTAMESDYRLMTDVIFTIDLERCGCFKVEQIGTPDPITLVYQEKETDSSTDLSDLFKDPLGEEMLFYNVEVEDGALISAELDRNPAPSGHRVSLTVSVTDDARSLMEETGTRIFLSAWPLGSQNEGSDILELMVKITKGPGSPPVWDLPEAFVMVEDHDLEVDLDEHIIDTDPGDQGTITFKLTGQSSYVSWTALDRSRFLLRPMKDFCGVVDGIGIRATDTFGWQSDTAIDIDVSCVPDGPVVVLSSPSTDDGLQIFEGEEAIFTVIANDPDQGDLVYDWYINGQPELADGGISYLFAPGTNTAGTHNITVIVYNSITGLKASTSWRRVTVEHINLAPMASIEIMGDPGATQIVVEVDDEVGFKGKGLDPEKGELTYMWHFGDGHTAKGKETDHTFDRPGKYIVTLMVSDGEFSTYAHVSVTVKSRTTIVSTPPTVPWVPALWLASIILMVTAVGIGSTEPGKFRIFVFLTMLYSKIKKTEVLDHYLRGRIQGYITANPGAHYNMIKMDLQINNGNLAYHLKVLERQGFIKSLRDGIYKRFYPLTMKVTRPPSLQEKILVLLRNHPGLTQKDIATRLDQSQSTVNDYIRRMVAAQLVRIERAGVKNHCYIFTEEDLMRGVTMASDAHQ